MWCIRQWKSKLEFLLSVEANVASWIGACICFSYHKVYECLELSTDSWILMVGVKANLPLRGQFHIPTALSPRESASAPIAQCAGWSLGLDWPQCYQESCKLITTPCTCMGLCIFRVRLKNDRCNKGVARMSPPPYGTVNFHKLLRRKKTWLIITSFMETR
jgi:hypothetical protein